MMMMMMTEVFWSWWLWDTEFDIQVGSIGLETYVNYVEKLRWESVNIYMFENSALCTAP